MPQPPTPDEPTPNRFDHRASDSRQIVGVPESLAAPEGSVTERGRDRPILAITVGDVAGVGPELALRCAALPQIHQRCLPILYGPEQAIEKIAGQLELPCPSSLQDIGTVDLDTLQPGRVTAETGLASYQAVDQAIADAIAGRIDGIVTGPIQKEAWHAAGIPFPGHTELLAERTGVSEFCMMLTSDAISCVLATIHVPLADVASLLTVQSVEQAIRLGAAALRRRLGRPARVTVCGLNPHAGEHGLFSHGEEERVIQPAIASAIADGLQVIGPVPPDTAFTPTMRQRTDVYVCMYHDQGLIPLKAIAFEDAVNVTLGLPIVRTSVDHGTALDLAWRGVAKHESMLAAIEMAIDLSRGSKHT